MIKKCLAKNLNSKKKCKSMTQESQVENHKLTHKVLDTKNLLVFVVSERLFFYYLGILYLFVLAHHPTGWRKLRIQIFGRDSKQENAFSVHPVVCATVLNVSTLLKRLTRMSTRMARHVGSHDSQLGLRYFSQAKMVIDKNRNRLGRHFYASFFFALYMLK